jgi:hypothetical protein
MGVDANSPPSVIFPIRVVPVTDDLLMLRPSLASAFLSTVAVTGMLLLLLLILRGLLEDSDSRGGQRRAGVSSNRRRPVVSTRGLRLVTNEVFEIQQKIARATQLAAWLDV